MIVYILLSFWTAGPRIGRKARTESVKFGFVLHIAHPRFLSDQSGSPRYSLALCQSVKRMKTWDRSRPLKTPVHFHSAATVQTLFCWLNLLFFQVSEPHIYPAVHPQLCWTMVLLFTAASVGSECNGSWMRWRNKNIYIYLRLKML